MVSAKGGGLKMMKDNIYAENFKIGIDPNASKFYEIYIPNKFNILLRMIRLRLKCKKTQATPFDFRVQNRGANIDICHFMIFFVSQSEIEINLNPGQSIAANSSLQFEFRNLNSYSTRALVQIAGLENGRA